MRVSRLLRDMAIWRDSPEGKKSPDEPCGSTQMRGVNQRVRGSLQGTHLVDVKPSQVR